jgi:hypothetical protein
MHRIIVTETLNSPVWFAYQLSLIPAGWKFYLTHINLISLYTTPTEGPTTILLGI